MRIKTIRFVNRTSGLKIKDIGFSKEKALLVGKSGAGKTQILQAIDTACKLACGELNKIAYAFELEIEFSVLNNIGRERVYCWQVEADFAPQFLEKGEDSNLIIKKESLAEEEKVLFLRDEETLQILDYEAVPAPKENESLISQYRQEERIRQAYWAFHYIYFGNIEKDIEETLSEAFYEELCRIHMGTHVRDYYLYDSPFDRYGIFQKVDTDFGRRLSEEVCAVCQECFPEIEQIQYMLDEYHRYGIAVRCGGKWITQRNISSGMLKTLWVILCLRLLPKRSVLLIDELENGLGVNCIENVCDSILNEGEGIQVIATSHHPYIINNIPMDNWMIVQREGSIVTSHDAEEFSLGKSKHDAYLQLINKL